MEYSKEKIIKALLLSSLPLIFFVALFFLIIIHDKNIIF